MSKAVYIHEQDIHNKKTPAKVLPLLFDIYRPGSVLDVGCGLGTWVSVAADLGVTDITGVDGDYLDRSLLTIPETAFVEKDLTQPFDLNRQFDLVISLEVAEHLPAAAAEAFIASIVRHGEVVLFSAALPGQGGQYHVNEQWLSYWKELFARHGYLMYDVMRPMIWDNKDIEVWYKQNMVVFCKAGHPLTEQLAGKHTFMVDIVHPELFAFYHKQAQRSDMMEQGDLGVKTALNALTKSISKKLK